MELKESSLQNSYLLFQKILLSKKVDSTFLSHSEIVRISRQIQERFIKDYDKDNEHYVYNNVEKFLKNKLHVQNPFRFSLTLNDSNTSYTYTFLENQVLEVKKEHFFTIVKNTKSIDKCTISTKYLSPNGTLCNSTKSIIDVESLSNFYPSI